MLRAVPPELREYQATVPIGLVGSVAVSITVPVPHRLAPVVVGAVTPPVVDNVIEVVAVQPPAS